MKRVLNVEIEGDGELGCPEVMGSCCLISEKAAAAIKELKIGKSSLSYWCSE